MKISDFDYGLPDNLIAENPPLIRGTSKLLVLEKSSGKILDKSYQDIPEYLNAGDVLVLNDTRVIKARLFARKQNGAKREIIILEKHGKNDDWFRHKIMYRGKLVEGDELDIDGIKLEVEEIIGNGIAIIKSSQDLLKLADKFGAVPLPPYIQRKVKTSDTERYQTIWAKQSGSVAAPTASLNMTNQMLEKLKSKGVIIVYITLHVGLGTFMPIRSDDVEKHDMHQEYFEIPKVTFEEINKAKNSGNRVIALGTTVARTLEYAADQIIDNPTDQICGEADIFIYPGYKFKMVDILVTNFHAPRSTVLLLAAAFAGWSNLENAYQHAIDNGYHFLSYGDSMLIV